MGLSRQPLSIIGWFGSGYPWPCLSCIVSGGLYICTYTVTKIPIEAIFIPYICSGSSRSLGMVFFLLILNSLHDHNGATDNAELSYPQLNSVNDATPDSWK